MAKKETISVFKPQSKCDEVTIKKSWKKYKAGQKVRMHPTVADKLKKLDVI